MALKPYLFLDTSALFAGIWSAQGGSRLLLRLGEAEVVHLLVSAQVLREIEDVFRWKAKEYLPVLAILLNQSRVTVVSAAPTDLWMRCKEFIHHAGDARILADAWHNKADYLVTLDRAHFLGIPDLAREIPIQIGTPGDCLAWLRSQFSLNDQELQKN